MNIAFVNATKKWGGVKSWCIDTGTVLHSQGHNVHILGRDESFLRKAANAGIPTRKVNFAFDFNPLAIMELVGYFLRHRIEVVAVNVAKDIRTAGIAGRMLGLKVIHLVGSGGDFDDGFSFRLTQRLIRAEYLCYSRFIAESIVRYAPFVRRFPMHVSLPGTEIPAAVSTGMHTPPVIIATSQLNADKRHEDLLRALARLQAEGFDFRAIIVGTGRLAQDLQNLAGELGLAGRIEWTGFVTNVLEQLRRADIFVLPTLTEPLGIALQEAMAQGLLPVARRSGGVPEIWPPFLTQYFAGPEPGPEGLYASLREILRLAPEEVSALRQEVWAHARSSFDRVKQATEFAAWAQS